MNKSGPIVLIDDDEDDLNFFNSALRALGVKNEILMFQKAEDFLEFMNDVKESVFFILCDINMPLINGFEVKKRIISNPALSAVSIPFIFLSTSSAAGMIKTAYKEAIQGYFIKPSNFEGIKTMFQNIINYWASSEHPPAE